MRFVAALLRALACALLVALPAFGSAQLPPALGAYVEGLDHMAGGRWHDAVTSFGQAIQGEPENAAYFTARGVAKTLAEDFPGGLKDLDRSLRLRPNDRETQLWQAACQRLQDQYNMNTSMVYGGTAPREYAIFVYNDLVIEYWRPGTNNGTDEKSRALFPRAGGWFADLAMGRGNMTPALVGKARAQLDAKDFEGALATVARLRVLLPDDNDVLRMEGFARLGHGDADTARATFTRLLTALTTDGDGYAGRAMARARLGDIDGAEKDVDLAKQHRSARVDEAKGVVAEEKKRGAGDRAAATSAFVEAANADAPWNDMVEKAVAVRRASNAERRRWDEIYQERVRVLEKALAEKPDNADRLVDLAEYLFNNSDVRGEQVEPRAGWRGYRWQTEDSKAREIARAEQLVDQALAKSPKHLKALGLKVRLRLHCMQNADAAQFYDRMIALGADDAQSKVVYAEMLDAISWQKAREAADLRAQDGRVEYSGDWMTTYSLTPEGWRQVHEKEALAEQFAKLAEDTLEAAAKALKGTPRGHYYQGKVHLRRGENDKAKAEFQKAVEKDREFAEAWDLLGSTLARLGDTKGAFDCRVTAWNIFETSAGLILSATRDLVVQTRFQTARGQLDAAFSIDPADARIYAYRGMTYEGDENPAEAFRWFRAALAMEEARAHMQGTSYGESGKGARTPGDFGLSWAARSRMAAASRALGRPVQERIDLARAGVACESRVAPADWTASVHSFMVPRYDADPAMLPQVPESIELLALSRVALGDALREAGDMKAADAEYAAALQLDARFREFVVNRADNYGLRDALHLALVGRGHALLGMDDYEGALQAASRLPKPRNPPAPIDGPANELRAALAKYKQEHGILTDVERQEKELDEMNEANRRMVEEALREREEQNREWEQRRGEQMRQMEEDRRQIDEQRRRQSEQMRRRGRASD